MKPDGCPRAAAQPKPLPVIEDIHTNTATAKEHVFPPAEAHRLHNSRSACFDVREQDVYMEEEWMACSRRCGPPFARALKPAA